MFLERIANRDALCLQKLGLTVFSGRFYILGKRDLALDLAVFLFKCPDILADQHQNMTVDTSPLKVSNIADLFKHFLFNSNRHTFHSYKNHSVDILCVYFIVNL